MRDLNVMAQARSLLSDLRWFTGGGAPTSYKDLTCCCVRLENLGFHFFIDVIMPTIDFFTVRSVRRARMAARRATSRDPSSKRRTRARRRAARRRRSKRAAARATPRSTCRARTGGRAGRPRRRAGLAAAGRSPRQAASRAAQSSLSSKRSAPQRRVRRAASNLQAVRGRWAAAVAGPRQTRIRALG